LGIARPVQARQRMGDHASKRRCLGAQPIAVHAASVRTSAPPARVVQRRVLAVRDPRAAQAVSCDFVFAGVLVRAAVAAAASDGCLVLHDLLCVAVCLTLSFNRMEDCKYSDKKILKYGKNHVWIEVSEKGERRERESEQPNLLVSLSLSLLSLSLLSLFSLSISSRSLSCCPSLTLSLCVSLSLSLYFSLFLSVFLSLSLSFSLHLSISLAHSLSLLSLSFFLSPSLSLSLTHSLSHSLSRRRWARRPGTSACTHRRTSAALSGLSCCCSSAAAAAAAAAAGCISQCLSRLSSWAPFSAISESPTKQIPTW
jgi:hypothetical protein